MQCGDFSAAACMRNLRVDTADLLHAVALLSAADAGEEEERETGGADEHEADAAEDGAAAAAAAAAAAGASFTTDDEATHDTATDTCPSVGPSDASEEHPHEDVRAMDRHETAAETQRQMDRDLWFVSALSVCENRFERWSLPSGRFLARHDVLSEYHFVILVDWMVEVSQMWQLLPQTLALAVQYVTVYLDQTKYRMLKQGLQLLGCTCLWLAGKINQVTQHSVKSYVAVTDQACKAQDVLDMELQVLHVLGFKTVLVTTADMIVNFGQAMGLDHLGHITVHSLYLSEISQHSVDLAAVDRATVAVACLALSVYHYFGDRVSLADYWNDNARILWTKRGAHPETLRTIAFSIHTLWRKFVGGKVQRLNEAGRSAAVQLKFSDPAFLQTSNSGVCQWDADAIVPRFWLGPSGAGR
eukprot:TRINITY_DN1004_c6_g1_i1.p1 TRINITY_DN1004_c6_g1~~TRINITY_DN1004_c6_g1_i1.p1  ORF type:complete len:431 (+),score=143.82 TRINITY_DN1004_c6_g1_i1:49-1293(+)